MVLVNWVVEKNLDYLETLGTVLGVGYTKRSTKGIAKTCWIELTSCVEEEKKGLSSRKVTLAYM